MIKYVNAYSRLWEEELSTIPSGADEIAGPLERDLLLQRFNRDFLGMQYSDKDGISNLIGVSMRLDKQGVKRPPTDFIISYLKRVINIFHTTPIAKQFGLTVKDAMSLPADQWYYIEQEAIKLSQRQEPSSEERMMKMMKEFMEMMVGVKGDQTP